MDNIVEVIQEQFINEAKQSPMLLADLANMEIYIAESYQNRSLIELLQNADDANARSFFFQTFGSQVVVANDGRDFTSEDIQSICRSGASTKARGTGTIGYRGIGFKTVVNFAAEVHIIGRSFSGMTFSRELTRKKLGMDIEVPLIRVPHQYKPSVEHIKISKQLFDKGYTTIFIFENLYKERLEDEIESFEPSSLLFLRHIERVEFVSKEINIITAKRINNDYGETIYIQNLQDEKEKWNVFRNQITKESTTALAFLLDDRNEYSPLDSTRSVVHSFMPTNEEIGLPIKINGDFSTDPSRTKLVWDDFSIAELNNSLNSIFEMVKLYTENNKIFDGSNLFQILSSFTESVAARFRNKKRFSDLLISGIKERFSTEPWFYDSKTGKYVSPNGMRINPSWLNQKDFVQLCESSGLVPLEKSYEAMFPGLLVFAARCGIRPMSIYDALESTAIVDISTRGKVETFMETIRIFRFNFDEASKRTVLDSKIIKFESETKKIADINFEDKISENYLKVLNEYAVNFSDLNWFFKQIGLDFYLNTNNEVDVSQSGTTTTNDVFGNSIRAKIISNEIVKKNENIEIAEVVTAHGEDFIEKLNEEIVMKVNKDIPIESYLFEYNTRDIQAQSLSKNIIDESRNVYTQSITRWRSAEINLAALLVRMNGVLRVADVSKSNLGYDLEVHRKSGVEYIEVKSVSNIGDGFAMTSNEFSTASEHGEQYVIAITKQNYEGMEVCYIRNPVQRLKLIKRITRWEWACDEYAGDIVKYKFQ